MDRTLLLRVCPGLSTSHALAWGDALAAAAEEWEINTPARVAMWVANLAHESQGFVRLVENMNYSAQRLAQVWPRRYAVDPRAIDKRPNELATFLGNKPDCVANDVYALRMGNGAPSTGHGWLYRGRYPVMLTGKANYEAANDALGVPDTSDPDALLQDLPGMARVCAWFWTVNGCNHFADANDFDGACDKINFGAKTDRYGDSIGFADRIEYFNRAKAALGIV